VKFASEGLRTNLPMKKAIRRSLTLRLTESASPSMMNPAIRSEIAIATTQHSLLISRFTRLFPR